MPHNRDSDKPRPVAKYRFGESCDNVDLSYSLNVDCVGERVGIAIIIRDGKGNGMSTR